MTDVLPTDFRKTTPNDLEFFLQRYKLQNQFFSIIGYFHFKDEIYGYTNT
jgi:hypothetical protein